MKAEHVEDIKVDFLVDDGATTWEAGEIVWNGAIYQQLLEGHAEEVRLADGEELYSPEEWRDVSAPEAVIEDLTEDPRKNSICCYDPKKPVEVVRSVKGTVYNKTFQKMIPGGETATMASVDFFRPEPNGFIWWGRAITEIGSEEPAFYKQERLSYDSEEHGFEEVAEALAEVGFKKQRPMTERVHEYFQDRRYVEDLEEGEEIHMVNKNFVEQQTTY